MKVLVEEFNENAWCPKCTERLPKRLLCSHFEIARCAFPGWVTEAMERLKELGMPEEMLLRMCTCGYAKLHYPVDSGHIKTIWVEVSE